MKLSKSHILVAKFLNGDKDVALDDIYKQESIDQFEYYLHRSSFGLKPLRIIMILPVAFYLIFFT